MFNRSLFLLSIFTLFLVGFVAKADASLYVRPRAGATIPINGNDGSYALGLTGGYQWTDLIATEVSYSRLIGTGNGPDGDLIQAEGILSYPMKYFSPYASAGYGWIHTDVPASDDWNSMILLGTGITFKPILFLSLGVGLTYSAVLGGSDFLQPYAAVGLSF